MQPRSKHRGNWLIATLLTAAIACGTLRSLFAQEAAPDYPKVNLATEWEVDPSWPQRPADVKWGGVSGMAVDAKDQVFVFTRAAPPVQIYEAATGKYIGGWGTDAISSAHHIEIDRKGFIWLADQGHHLVQKYSPDGKLLLSIGTPGKSGKDQYHLSRPTDMAIASNGDIYVSDGYGNARIVRYNKDGKYISEWGKLGQKPGQFSLPHAIAVDSRDRLYVADRNNARVQVFNKRGKFLNEWRDLIVPWGFHVTKDDEIWVCGSSPMQWRPQNKALGCPPKDQIFMKFSPEGKVLQLFTLPKGEDGKEQPGQVNWVHAIAFDSQQNMYLGDIIGQRAQKFVLKNP